MCDKDCVSCPTKYIDESLFTFNRDTFKEFASSRETLLKSKIRDDQIFPYYFFRITITAETYAFSAIKLPRIFRGIKFEKAKQMSSSAISARFHWKLVSKPAVSREIAIPWMSPAIQSPAALDRVDLKIVFTGCAPTHNALAESLETTVDEAAKAKANHFSLWTRSYAFTYRLFSSTVSPIRCGIEPRLNFRCTSTSPWIRSCARSFKTDGVLVTRLRGH